MTKKVYRSKLLDMETTTTITVKNVDKAAWLRFVADAKVSGKTASLALSELLVKANQGRALR